MYINIKLISYSLTFSNKKGLFTRNADEFIIKENDQANNRMYLTDKVEAWIS